MVQVRADAEVPHHFAELLAGEVAVQLAQAVFAEDVHPLSLVGVEGAAGELQHGTGGRAGGEAERSGPRFVGRAFLAFEVHGVTQCLIEIPEFRLAVLRGHIVAVA